MALFCLRCGIRISSWGQLRKSCANQIGPFDFRIQARTASRLPKLKPLPRPFWAYQPAVRHRFMLIVWPAVIALTRAGRSFLDGEPVHPGSAAEVRGVVGRSSHPSIGAGYGHPPDL